MRQMLALLLALGLQVALAEFPGNNTNLWDDSLSSSVRECVSQEVDGVMDCLRMTMRNRLREAEQQERFAMLGGLLQFERIPVVHGTVIRTTSAEYRVGRQEADDGLMDDVDRLSRKFTLYVNLVPGVDIRVQRADKTLNIGLDLDVDEDYAVEEGRGKKKKKKKKKSKKSKLKKLLPLLLIPVAIQFLMLPKTLIMLKAMALKALLASKLALILVLVNGLWTLFAPRHNDMMTKISQAHYGYDGNLEYGAYVNRRALLEERDRALWKSQLPYRAHK